MLTQSISIAQAVAEPRLGKGGMGLERMSHTLLHAERL